MIRKCLYKKNVKMRKSWLVGISLVLVALLGTVGCVATATGGAPNSPTPGKSLLRSAAFIIPNTLEGMVEIKAGETEQFTLTLETRKDGPGMVTHNVFRVKENAPYISDMKKYKIPMPDGLSVIVKPSEYKAFPHETYHPILTIKTSPDLPQGKYRFSLHTLFEGVAEGWHDFTINVK